MAENHHSYTAILLLVFALLVLAGAIFLTIAQTRVTGIDEYKAGNSKLNSAKNNLLIAYILGYIAAGMGMLLAVLYFGHVAWGINNEIPHLIVFILLFGLVIVSGIFGFLAISNIDAAKAKNTNGSVGWIWASLVAGLIALILLVISGAWRAQHLASKSGTSSTADQQEATLTAPSDVNYMSAPQVMGGMGTGMPNPDYQAPAFSPRAVYKTSSYEAV